METYLINYRDESFKMPTLLEWNFSYGSALPCDAFEVCFIHDKSMTALLEDAYRFRAVFEGKTVFFGVVDEFEVSASERGAVAWVRGRGLAALLLDNEAEAAQYFSASLDTILDKYVHPFGIRDIRRSVSPPVQSIVVNSGASAWRVLEDFMWFGSGLVPRFSRDGVLLLGEEPGERIVINERTAVFLREYKRKRYGVISEVLVKNKAAGSVNRVENADFSSRGGRARRVVNVPRQTRFDAMRSTGEYQIQRSMEDETRISLTLYPLFAAFPGDVAEISDGVLGLGGRFAVRRTRCFGAAAGAGTEIILSRQVQ